MAQENETKQPAISKIPVFLAGAGLGLIACYMLDPQHGKSRRANLRDRGSKHLETGWRAMLHRLTGFLQDFTHRGPSMAQVTEALKDPKAVSTAKNVANKAAKAAADTVDQLNH